MTSRRVACFVPKYLHRDLVAQEAADLELRLAEGSKLEAANEPVVVVDARMFPNIEALTEQLKGCSAPVLVLAEEDQLTDLLGRLGPKDDLCQTTTPPALILHRIRMMLSRPDLSSAQLLSRMQTHDPLTGVATKRVFMERLGQIVDAATSEQPISLLFVDFDHFKRLNDTFGHLAGDEVLQQLGRRLADVLPTRASFGRYGGEEFAVALVARTNEAVELADQIRSAVEKGPFTHDADGKSVKIECTVSVGVMTMLARHASTVELIKGADEALYAAKAHGRNCVVHNTDLEREAIDKNSNVQLETFQNMARVLAERAGELIARRGRRIFEEIREQADVDALTGLYSRRYFDRRLKFEHELASKEHLPFTVALLDIDHFGQFNKQHGFPTGDAVLSEVAERVRSAVRSDDWVARYGGEEICIVMQQTTIEDAKSILERVRKAVSDREFKTTDGTPVTVTLSIGAAQQIGREKLKPMMERVSAQLLMAKRAGRNRLCL